MAHDDDEMRKKLNEFHYYNMNIIIRAGKLRYRQRVKPKNKQMSGVSAAISIPTADKGADTTSVCISRIILYYYLLLL